MDQSYPQIRVPATENAALTYAKRGLSVFRLRRGTKEPFYGSRGFYDATTNEAQIRKWWWETPTANVAVATGAVSHLLVVDVDAERWGFGSLEAWESEYGELPQTYTVKTGGGGLHLYFRLPADAEVKSKGDALGLGVDVKCSGGYVVAPPSESEKGPYTVLQDCAIVEAPPALLESLQNPQNAVSEGVTTTPATPVAAAGTTIIPEGSRDDELTKIAGRLHDGSRTRAELEATLLTINEARCTPPLPKRQVIKIARSIHSRTPCKATRRATPEVLEILDRIETELWRREWPGMGKLSARDAYVALIKAAREHGKRIPGGVRISISTRTWALAAGISKRAMLDYQKNGERKPGVISRLKKLGLIRSDSVCRQEGEAGAFVLVLPRAEFHHSSTVGGADRGETLRAPRLRWSAPLIERIGDEVYRSTIRRLGKGCGAVIDALERAGGTATVQQIATALHKSRMRDLRRRVIARLEEAAVVECSGDSVSLTQDWLTALNREREISGEIAAMRRDVERYNREREAYKNRHRVRPDPVPAKPPAGRICELERVPQAKPALVAVLREFLRRNPHRWDEHPGWLSVAVWADYDLPEKPPSPDVEAALACLAEAS
jgi:hypothetical protein